jgi:hypothetical protein
MSNNGQQQKMMTNRDVHWSMVAVSSTVALVALVTDYDGKLSDQAKEYKWAAAAISIAFSLAWIATFANLFWREKFFGTVIEGGMVSCSYQGISIPIFVSVYLNVL